MKIDILTLFPNMFDGVFTESIIKRAKEKGLIDINIINFRDYSTDLHHKVDDTPYGGGAGMVLACEPIYRCLNAIKTENSKVILLTPDGEIFKEKIASGLAKETHLILICGHYEGFDERIKNFVDMEISIGDYILTGGEIPAMALVDAITRLIPGVINEQSYTDDSFYNNYLLDYPTYTKPQIFEGLEVPEILLSGNHKKIEEWRREMSIQKTQERRPDLWEMYNDKRD